MALRHVSRGFLFRPVLPLFFAARTIFVRANILSSRLTRSQMARIQRAAPGRVIKNLSNLTNATWGRARNVDAHRA